ncbi:MAG: 1-acyl-sn-glycerol-3-phosphate acyltransferase [Pyrinomonadaceae bacterium]|nr:1-acyl-sn-glycerol-3-phosphate acyltransferase [Pyrinomonadaceae bacterium]
MKNIRAAIRFISFLGATFGLYGIWWIGDFVIPNKIYWRQIIFRNWARYFVKISRMKVEVIGTPPHSPFFLVCNHLSYMDIPTIRAVVEGIYVAKGEIESWFAAGKIVRDMGNIYINRQCKRDIPRAGLDVLNALERGEGVIIFPEGTSTKGEEVLPFKSSFLEFAASTDLPVHYASISYQTPLDEPPPSYSVCWWDDTTFIEHLWRFFQLKEVTAIINFGEEPIVGDDRKKLAKDLWEAVSEKFIPVL